MRFTKTVREPLTALQITTLFVYPVHFAGTTNSTARSVDLSYRMLDIGLAKSSDSFEFFGPTEFQVLRFDDDAAWVASTALPLLTNRGSRLDQGLVIRARVEKRITGSLQAASDAKGRERGTSSNEVTTWIGSIEVLHPATRVVVAEVHSSVDVDAFAVADTSEEFDEAPAMTHMMEGLMSEVLKLVRQHAAIREPSPMPKLLLAITPKSLPVAVDGETLKLDALQAELLMQNRTRFLSPSLNDLEASKLLNAPRGLRVLKSESPKLNPGDTILSVDEHPALPQSIYRTRFAGHPAQLQVLAADGTKREVVFP